MNGSRTFWWVAGFIVGLCLGIAVARAQVPPDAVQFERSLIREARLKWGLGAPVAVLGGQIEQESHWSPSICSAYACGLAQFTPQTAKWISGAYPGLRENQPFNPSWAIRALVFYDYDLAAAVPRGQPCEWLAFTLSAYNGGPGWIKRDQELCREAENCDPDLWWGNVELYTPRSKAAARENRGYPRRIMLQLQHHYASWGGEVSCKGGPS